MTQPSTEQETQPLTKQEKEDMKEVLAKLYGSQVQNWKITIKTFEVLERLIKKTKSCDDVMDLVPRPFGGGAVVRWGLKQVRDVILRKLKGNDGKHYIVCMRGTALSMKVEFIQAGYGI